MDNSAPGFLSSRIRREMTCKVFYNVRVLTELQRLQRSGSHASWSTSAKRIIGNQNSIRSETAEVMIGIDNVKHWT